MRKNIFIRMLCLLLCVSMLLPIEAAASSLLYDYPTRSPQFIIGKKTNEMAYVDQLFTEAGNRNARRSALNKWLSSEPKERDYRPNSGYLMLDEEVCRNSGKVMMAEGRLEKNDEADWHMFKEFNARFLGPVADYFASGGASVVISLGEDLLNRHKFKGAGKSAEPYYTQLCQVYYEYSAKLQNEVKTVDETLGKLAGGIGSIAEVAPDTVRITMETNVLMLSGKGTGAPLNYKVTDVDFDKKLLIVQSKGTKGATGQSVHFSALDKNVKLNNSFINYDMTDLDDTVRSKLLKKLNINVKPGGVGVGEINGMHYKHVQAVVENVDEIRGMTSKEKEALKKNLKPTEEIDISKEMQAINIIGSSIQAINSSANVTAQQTCYLNALTNMSKDYLEMLHQWYKDVETYEVPFGYGDVQRDILAAIKAIEEDVLDLQAAGTQELADAVTEGKAVARGIVYNAGEFAEILLDISEAAGWNGISDFIKVADKDLFGSEELASRVSGMSALLSFGLNLITADFLEFEDKASTIYNLKWSLEELLLNEENGLLEQYAQERTHNKACEIIRALDTMKILKIMGENLIEEYYLCDFYDSQGLNISSAAHLVLRNEMAQRTSNGRLDASDSFTPIIAVLEDTSRIAYDYYYGYAEVINSRTILGYYVKDSSTTITYEGLTLTTLPSNFSGLTQSAPVYGIKNVPTNLSEEWLKGKIAIGNNYDKMYIDHKAVFYSDNGLKIPLLGEDYEQYKKLEEEINTLLNKYDDVNDIFWRKWEKQDHSKKEENRIEKEQEYHERLQWTITTRGWIESFEMFDSNTDYFTHEVVYVPAV